MTLVKRCSMNAGDKIIVKKTQLHLVLKSANIGGGLVCLWCLDKLLNTLTVPLE